MLKISKSKDKYLITYKDKTFFVNSNDTEFKRPIELLSHCFSYCDEKNVEVFLDYFKTKKPFYIEDQIYNFGYEGGFKEDV